MKRALLSMVVILYTITISAQLPKSKMHMPAADQVGASMQSLQEDLAKQLAKGPVKLNPYFKADDGSIVCLRQIEDMVYGIADRMDRRFSSVWVGKIEGSTLRLNYFYIPKGKAKGSGEVVFAVSGSGAGQRLTLKSTAKNTFSKTPLNIKTLSGMGKLQGRFPVDERAWYRGNTLDNLTGRWQIKNVGEEYVLDLGDQVLIYTVGGRGTPNARPQFASLFIGDRTGNDIKGFYVDLPYGHTIGFGKAAFKVVGPQFIRASYNHFYYGVDRQRITSDKNEILP